jgi:non-specific serine/threonine protein kinase
MIGKTLGHYRVLSALGAGGMGEVYVAEDTKLRRRVALKILPRRLADDRDRQRRFQTEAQAIAALNHPGIVTVHSVEEAEGIHFLTMELVEGRTLDAVVTEGGLELDRLVALAGLLSDAIGAAHVRGITHRDLKPANVMLTAGGGIKVLDFGLAKLREDNRRGSESMIATAAMTRDGEVIGTLPYMSPEQVRGETVDHRSDIFSLGVILYELAAGSHPFASATLADMTSAILRDDPPPLTDFNPDLPEGFARVVRRCLEKDPDRRWQSALDVRNEIEELAKGEPASAEGPPSIAVLPFADMSAEKDQDWFCEGIAEEITNALAKIEGLRVASRTSAFQFRGAGGDCREIGRRLGVRTLLEGSVRKAGDRLRIGVQLVKAADGYRLWSERYDRQLEDIFAIQDEIARRVVDELELALTPRQQRALRTHGPESIEAYEYYLRGLQFIHRLGKTGCTIAREMFERAIEVDPSFATAYAWLATTHTTLFSYYDSDPAHLERACELSLAALRLDAGLADAHVARGLALSLSGVHGEAEQAFEVAVRLDPRSWAAHYYFARLCWARGDHERAAELFRRAAAIQPDDYQAPALLSNVLDKLGRRPEAQEACRTAVAMSDRRLQTNPDDVRALYLGAAARARLGETRRALAQAERAQMIDPGDPAVLYNLACLYAYLGERDRSTECLAEAVANGFAHRQWIENDSSLDPIRDHPRYREVLDRLAPGAGG